MIKLYESCNSIICIYAIYIPYINIYYIHAIYHTIYIYIFIWYGIYVSGGHSKSTVSQDCQILTPLPPCSSLFVFVHSSFQRLPPLISLVELNVSFKKTQRNLYKVDTTSAWQKCPLYGWRKRSHVIHW